MTVLQIINRVLRRLRESTVATLAETEYSTMLVDFLHDVHQQCLDHDWSSMEHVIDVPVDASQRVLNLSQNETAGGDVTDASTVPGNDSMLRFDENGRPLVFLFDDSSATDGSQMVMVDEQTMERLYQTDRSSTSDEPYYFSLRAHPSRAGLQMTIWPVPTAARHIRMRFWSPEDEIDIDTDVARTPLVPSRLLVLGTLMLALNERGEELGEPGNTAESRFYNALGSAVEADQDRRSRTNRFEAVRE